jgi:hypothetical protein
MALESPKFSPSRYGCVGHLRPATRIPYKNKVMSLAIGPLVELWSVLFLSSSFRPSLWITHKESEPLPTTRASAGWWMLTTANSAGANSLTCLLKHGILFVSPRGMHVQSTASQTLYRSYFKDISASIELQVYSMKF